MEYVVVNIHKIPISIIFGHCVVCPSSIYGF